MTINEKTRLLPKDYQKSYVISISSQEEDLNNNTSSTIIQDYDSYALTKEELAKYMEDPFWTRVRCICFSLYWLLCVVALCCSCYLAAEALDAGICDVVIDGNGSSLLDNGTLPTLPPATLPINTAAADNSGVVLRMLNQPSS